MTDVLDEESGHDPLTGLRDHRRVEAFLEQAVEDAGGSGRPISLILAGVDGLEAVNDAHGRAAGDAILRSIARCLEATVRARDFVGRHGGDQFAIILPGAPPQAARAVAERVRAEVAGADHPLGGGHALRATISVGCATFEPGHFRSALDLVEAARQALDAAKRSGRNRVEGAAPAPVPDAR